MSSFLGRLCRVASLVFVVAVIALSVQNSPAVWDAHWVPRGLAAWADQNPQVRHAACMMPLSLLMFFGFCRSKPAGQGRRELVLLLMLASVITLLEFLQQWQSRRSSDMGDVMAGFAGILIGWGIFRVCRGRAASLGKTLHNHVPLKGRN